MKKLLLFAITSLSALISKSQNTFPSSGNVGIGTTNPGVVLSTRSNINSLPALSGTTQAGGAFRVEGGDNAVIDFGTNSVNTWLQATDKTSLNYNYYLNLNPNGGNVGVGILYPGGKLTTRSNVNTLPATSGSMQVGSALRVEGGDNAVIDFGANSVNTWIQATDKTALQYKYNLNLNPTGGNVGIGTVNPDQKLSVAGTVHSQAVKVDMTGWSDCVFKPAYNLTSLENVRSFIDKNHHLPGMPSENEVIKNGIDLGEMLKLQQKKIEELTLYIIDQDKRISSLEKKIIKPITKNNN